MTLKTALIKIRYFILPCLLSAATTITCLPFVNRELGRDPGVFFYIGWRMLFGEVPYRDIWDHKPPIISFLNWLGQLLTPGSRWGMVIIEFIFFLSSFIILYHLLDRLFSKKTAIIGIICYFLMLFFRVQGGNFTTEYTILFQLISLSIAIRIYENERFDFKNFLIIGAMGALAFLTKQTAIGISMAIVTYLIITFIRRKHYFLLFKGLGLMFLGSILIFLPVALYFIINNAFFEFLSAAFGYNFYYASVDFLVRLRNIANFFTTINEFPLVQFALLGLTVFLLKQVRGRHLTEIQKDLYWVAMIGLPIEIVLITGASRIYWHYYQVVLLTLTLLAAFFFHFIFSQLSAMHIPNKKTVCCILCNHHPFYLE